MKKLLASVVLAAMVLGLAAGCEDDTDEKAKELTFVNQSAYVVQVIPLTIEWGAFALAPGDRQKLKDIDNPDFRFEPESLVQEGINSEERYVVFVNALPSEGE